MKVLIATGLYPPEIGGPATHTRMLESGLPAHGVEVEVLPFRSVRKFPPIVRHLVYARKLYKAGRTADLLFAQDPFSCGLPALIATHFLKIPLVVRIPGDYAWEQARERHGVTDTVDDFQHKKYGFMIELTRTLEQFVVRRADHVVTPSTYVGRIVAGWGPRALSVIANGVDVPGDVVKPATLPRRPFIVTASRLIHGKGFECLIDLMQELSAWHLVIVGGGPLEKQLKERVKRVGVAERVMFAGPVSREEMFGWYAAASVFVLNTEFETFSFQVVEALASATPLITTEVGGIPEIVRNGVHGLLLQPNDRAALVRAIKSITEDPETWSRRREAGVRRAGDFSSEKAVVGFAELFKKLCQK